MAKEETIARLRRFLEHAPKVTKSAVDGWLVDDGVVICGTCAGRILDRGCSIGAKSVPLDGEIRCELCKGEKS